jgi:hypothetical protein
VPVALSPLAAPPGMTVNDKNDELRLNHIFTLTNGTVDENHTDITSSTIKNCANQEPIYLYSFSETFVQIYSWILFVLCTTRRTTTISILTFLKGKNPNTEHITARKFLDTTNIPKKIGARCMQYNNTTKLNLVITLPPPGYLSGTPRHCLKKLVLLLLLLFLR